MYRLAVFKILATQNVIDEVLTEKIIGVNTAKILTIDDAPTGSVIKLETSPRHTGLIFVAESRHQVLSKLGYQAAKTLTLTKANNTSFTISTEHIYYSYIKKERTVVIYWDGRKMSSVFLKNTFVNFVTLFNTLDNLTVDSLTADTVRSGSGDDWFTIEDGELVLTGDKTVWDDIRIVPTIWDTPGQLDPNPVDYYPEAKGSPFRMWGFDKGDRGWFVLQLPHGYKEGSTLYAHVHWTAGSRGGEEDGHTVQWGLDYSFASINDYFPSSTTITWTDTVEGGDDRHMMTSEVAISGAGLTISAEMLGMIYRINNGDTWVGNWPNLPLFIEFDIHYEIDALGSRTSTSK